MKNRWFAGRWQLMCLVIYFQFSYNVFAQDSLSVSGSDSITRSLYKNTIYFNSSQQYPYNKKRMRLVTAGNIIGYSGAMVGLYSAWYSKYPQTRFHIFNDNREWLQVDKVGHAYSAYAESYGSMEMWRWTGISRKQRIILGGLSGAAYQTVIEILDGFSEGWGWSWGDFGANVLGSGLLAGQELAWDEQRIRFKFSFHKKKYGSAELTERANELFGESTAERFIKDYNAQSYWLSANVKSFMPKSNLPPWLNVAVGYGAEGMFGGEENIGKDENGNVTFYRPDIKRYRQWYLAPDIDFSRIKTNNKVLRFTLGVLNVVKFPTPSLEFSNKKMRWNWMHF
ncbi:MAG TPA: DUF2279 domain-containing protein [Segetibacter sp.]